jgi:hypothetical protein
MNIFQRWKQTTLANKGLVFSSILMAFGTLFYAGAAIVQVCIMKQSAHDMSLQTDKLINAAQAEASASQKIADASDRNAAAAKSFSASADQIRSQTERAVVELKRGADDSENAIKVASANAQNALAASIKTVQIDERAWLGLDRERSSIEGPKKPSSVMVGKIVLWARNSGKTPAINIDGFVILTTGTWDGPEPNYDAIMKKHGWSDRSSIGVNYTQNRKAAPEFGNSFAHGQILAPGADNPFEATIENAIQDDTLTRDRPDGTLFIYVLGSFSYDDVFMSARHVTKWCFVQRMPSNTFVPCNTGQEMN